MVGLLVQWTPMGMTGWHYLPSHCCPFPFLSSFRLPDYYVTSPLPTADWFRVRHLPQADLMRLLMDFWTTDLKRVEIGFLFCPKL